MLLENKVAIVTAGAGRGIGSSIVRRFAAEGAAVAIVDFDLEGATALADEIKAGGGQAIAVQADVAEQDDVLRAVSETVAAFGTVSILINHAGIGRADLIERMTYEQWRRICAVNLDGTFFFTQAVIPYMKENNWGRIVSTASRAAYRASRGAYARGMAAYAATKLGIVGFSRAAAFELGPYQITVNVIAPGLTSPDNGVNLGDPSLEGEGQVLPLRFVEPDEIAAAAMYLVGPGADRTTGQVLHVNSGSYFNA
ncbi:MAG: SDR family NAD(P)-dependent oxidoreductase [Acidimicrobiia bacterium]